MKTAHATDHLIIFSRYPAPGTTKTRLIPALGAAGAAALQRQLTEQTVCRLAALAATCKQTTLEVCHEGGSRNQMKQWLGPHLIYTPQGNGDLGLRMHKAFDRAFKAGSRRVIIVGSDCPELSAGIVEMGLGLLGEHDLVLGPAADGGYYLIGLRRSRQWLFDDIEWGGTAVLADTMMRAKKKGLTVALLEELNDLDRPDDLARRTNRCTPLRAMQPQVSIIIPTLNEGDHIAPLVGDLVSLPGVEVIVADGNSSDDTVERAKAAGARLVHSAAGRGRQMNSGAAVASGKILLFLHADTWLEPGFIPLLHTTLAEPGTVAGAFRLAINAKGAKFRLVEWLANLRSTWLKMPYGDQGIFLYTTTFKSVEGYQNLPVMEDFEFTRTLRRRGRIAILGLSATTSPRRWERLGVLRTTLVNQAMLAAYLLGIAPERLARWYRGEIRQ